MTRETVHTDAAPSSPLYAQAVKAGNLVYVSGTPGLDAATGQLVGPTIHEQMKQALANCADVLGAAGASFDDVVEVGVLLARPEDFAGMNEVYSEVFADDPPTRYVAKLGVTIPDLLVSVRMTAFTG